MDYDFRHIVTFLNRLSEAELKALPLSGNLSSRKIQVELEFTSRPNENQDLLIRWLKRLEHPTKKGTKIEAVYTLKSDAVMRLPLAAPWRVTWLNRRIAVMGPGRMQDEAKKIRAGMDAQRYAI